jgi:hypothetical protein
MGATYTRQSASAIVDGAVIEASDLNAEFDQILAAFAVTSGHTHDGTAAEGGPITKLLGTAITIGDATAGTDIAVTFDGETADGVLTWMEDEDYFKFSDDILMNSTERLNFGDTGTYIFQSTDGQLDIVADTEVQIAATTIDINGAVDISGALTLAGVTLAETISDTVGAMVTSNTESGITVTYDDADNTLDFTVGTLNQNTTGNAATATALETARTIGGTSFDGTANIAVALAATSTALATARTIAGQSFDGSANIAIASTDLSNTSNITLNDGTQTLTNKTLTSPIISSISNTGTITLPTATDTLVGRATTDTLTNKTLTSPVFSGTATDFTSTGIDDNATSTAITINSSEQVGIGTASPSEILHIEGNSPYLVISNTGENVGGIKMYDSADSGGQYFHLTYDSASSNEVSFDTGASGEYTFNVNTAEAMRIDSSGNVGIGTNSPNNYAGYGNITLNGTSGGIFDLGVNGTRTGTLLALVTETRLSSITNIPLTFSTNNAERMRIDSSGNVGIGTSSPGAKLEVRGSAIFNEQGLDADFRVEGDTDANLLFVDASTDRVGIGTNAPGAKFEVRGSAIFNEQGLDADFRVEGDTDASLFFVDASTDRVGIGTTSPDAKLSVNGVASFGDGTALLPSIANFGDLNTGMWFPAADTIAFSEGGAEAMRITSAGRRRYWYKFPYRKTFCCWKCFPRRYCLHFK